MTTREYQDMVIKMLALTHSDIQYAKRKVEESKTGRSVAAREIIQDVTKFISREGWIDTLCMFIGLHPEVYKKRVEEALDEFWSVVEKKSAQGGLEADGHEV